MKEKLKSIQISEELKDKLEFVISTVAFGVLIHILAVAIIRFVLGW